MNNCQCVGAMFDFFEGMFRMHREAARHVSA